MGCRPNAQAQNWARLPVDLALPLTFRSRPPCSPLSQRSPGIPSAVTPMDYPVSVPSPVLPSSLPPPLAPLAQPPSTVTDSLTTDC